MNEVMKRWLQDHPDATLRDAFESGWMACTEAWCHGKRERMEQICEMMKELIS